MGKRYDLLVFDWDGTLLDSTGAIVESVKAACRDLGQPEPSADHARQVIGLGLDDALRHSAPDLSEDRFPLFVERYRYHYLTRDQDLRLFDGTAELIAELQASGFLLAVATGKSRPGLNRSLAHTGLGSRFLATRCVDECFSKPHPQMLVELMDECLVSPSRTLMIGDTTHDLQMAVNAGVAGLAVTYGAHSVSSLSEVSSLSQLDTIAALAGWLRENA